MQSNFLLVYVLFLCMFINPSLAMAVEASQESSTNLRIVELLPNLCCPLAVNPGIPADFIAMSPNGNLDPYDWIYWGPKEVLKSYFENPASLKVPLIRVKLSANVNQTGPDTFCGMESIKKMDKKRKGLAFFENKWGDYPVLAMRKRIDGKLIYFAWVGLNDPEAGWTLLFNLVFPDEKDHPNNDDRKLWANFLKETSPLKDEDYFKACGQDLQEGYTLVNVSGAKLKLLAEKRQLDGALQVVVIPASTNIEFKYCDMMECLMGAKWKHGQPLVKVFGEITVNNQNIKSTTNYVTSIFYKTVPDFSLKKGDDKNALIFQKKMPQNEKELNSTCQNS